MPATKPATESPQSRRKRRLFPSLWLRLILAIPLALMLWMHLSPPMEDQGIANMSSIMLGAVLIFVAGIWFVFFSGYRWRTVLLTIAGVVAAAVLFSTLFRYEGLSGDLTPVYSFRLAGGDSVLASLSDSPATGAAAAIFTATDDDFPGFLGANRSGAVTHVALARSWDTQAPQLLWKQPIGAGWSGFSVVNGIALTMEQRGGEEAVTAYVAATGELLWSHSRKLSFTHPMGGAGPRSTPTIHGGRVYALNTDGRLVCLDGGSGELVWEKDLLAEYDVTPEQEFANVQYGRSNSPLVVGEAVIIPAGGDSSSRLASLVAYHAETGERLWEGGSRQISFASPRLTELAGVRQILTVNEDTLGGHDPDTGQVLWEHPWPGVTSANANVSQAVPVPPDRVFISKGYGGGAALLRLEPARDGNLTVDEVWKSETVLRTKFTNVAITGGHVYGLSNGILECVNLETGERVWKRGRYGHGQILLVADLLLLLSEDGELVLLEITPEAPDRVLGRLQVVDGTTWNNLALYGDLLLVRNGREAAALRLPLAAGRTARR